MGGGSAPVQVELDRLGGAGGEFVGSASGDEDCGEFGET